MSFFYSYSTVQTKWNHSKVKTCPVRLPNYQQRFLERDYGIRGLGHPFERAHWKIWK
jgi:hypothetical protein